MTAAPNHALQRTEAGRRVFSEIYVLRGQPLSLSLSSLGADIFMNHPKEPEVAGRLINIISDAFNRSLGALEKAGAIDTKKLNKHYTGIGSKYYDIVTEQIELTIRSGAPWICELFPEHGAAPDKSTPRA